jgi:hypothetical protein
MRDAESTISTSNPRSKKRNGTMTFPRKEKFNISHSAG